MTRRLGSYILTLLVIFANCTVPQVSRAGEFERLVINSCAMRGFNVNPLTMMQCSGLYVTPVQLVSCETGGPCMDPVILGGLPGQPVGMPGSPPGFGPPPGFSGQPNLIGTPNFLTVTSAGLQANVSPGTFGPLPDSSVMAVQTAINCVSQVPRNAPTLQQVGVFANCAQQQVILPDKAQAILDCSVSSATPQAFGYCAAPAVGISLSDDQKSLLNCARSSAGDSDRFMSCEGNRIANQNLSREQRGVLNCARQSSSADSFATCAASKMINANLTRDQSEMIECAKNSNGDVTNFTTCEGSSILGSHLSDDQNAVLGCAQDHNSDTADFTACAAGSFANGHMNKEGQIAVRCAVQSNGDPTGFATCAGANFFALNLNLEQQIAVQCIVETGGQPYAAAGCIATQLTGRELEKCFTHGVGGSDGCFGDDNDLVGKNGWVARSMGQIAGGPNSIIRNPDQIWGGDNSFLRRPGQIWGGPNSFIRNPSQFWGGNDSVFNNPSQLNIQVGSVGGHRICIPWC